jgi:hypothetical protein
MKIITFRDGTSRVRTGALINERVIDLNRANERIPSDLPPLIKSGQEAMPLT